METIFKTEVKKTDDGYFYARLNCVRIKAPVGLSWTKDSNVNRLYPEDAQRDAEEMKKEYSLQ